MPMPTSVRDVTETMTHEKSDPPTNIHGEWICARACIDGSRCLQRVTTPMAACVVHDDAAPIIPPGDLRDNDGDRA
jgi:hypothetical protein